MNTLIQNNIPCILLLIGCLLFWGCNSAQQLSLDDGDTSRVENVRFSQESDTVTVNYDLVSPDPDNKYRVNLILATDDNRYRIDLGSLSGDVGEKITPGEGKRIEWDMRNEIPEGTSLDNIRFVVNAAQHRQRNNSWVFYTAAGALLAGGGVLAGFILSPEDSDAGLPLPPSRPGINY